MNATSKPKKHSGKNLFVLDTNVPMHDPTSLFRFQEHSIFFPMITLEEMDGHKKGKYDDIARNVRQTSRFLDELVQTVHPAQIQNGIPLAKSKYAKTFDKRCKGRLFFQTEPLVLEPLRDGMTQGKNDNTILKVVAALQKARPDTRVVLVSKDINMRIKAIAMGLNAEDYFNDQAVDDINLLSTGEAELPIDFWQKYGKIESWADGGRTFYKVSGPLVRKWYPNQFLYLPDDSDDPLETIVRKIENKHTAILEVICDYRARKNNVWGIMAKNREQNFAFNALMDPEIHFVSLLGTAGTGKTLLALASGLTQVMEHKLYKEIVMTRETVPVGEDIGFLPGTEEEKMAPWMGALMDNLELLGSHNIGKSGVAATEKEQTSSNNLLLNRIKIRSLNFMRGRTFLNRYLIVDEGQNLTSKQMKTLTTRAGPGTKIICIGNLGQIDTPYLTATTSGLTYLVDRFKSGERTAHITLKRGERSWLADYAEEVL
ncbi:MAG: PhoH family protein [Parcubacteria group bacterium]|nr:PhoH family protein [Parcubacteria group bacterium]